MFAIEAGPNDIVFGPAGVVSIAAMLVVLVGAIGVIYRQLVASYEKQLVDLQKQADARLEESKERGKSYAEIGKAALDNLETAYNRLRATEGKEPMATLARVVPEHHSPVTEEQQLTADLQTDRARLVALTLAMGLPVREAGTPETEEQRRARKDARGGKPGARSADVHIIEVEVPAGVPGLAVKVDGVEVPVPPKAKESPG